MGGDGGFGHCKRSISRGMDIWKDIRKEWDEFVAFTSSVVKILRSLNGRVKILRSMFTH